MLLWLGSYTCLYLSIFLGLIVARFLPRFHSGHLAPSEGSCFKRQTTLRWPHWIFVLIQWPSGNVQSWFRHPLLISKHNACALHLGEPKKNKQNDTIADVSCSIDRDQDVWHVWVLQILHIWICSKSRRRHYQWTIYQEPCQLMIITVQTSAISHFWCDERWQDLYVTCWHVMFEISDRKTWLD